MTSGAVGTIARMAAVDTAHRPERRRIQDRRRPSSRLDPTELGRLRSVVRAVATVDRERADRLEARMADLERELDRVLELLELEPLPPTQE